MKSNGWVITDIVRFTVIINNICIFSFLSALRRVYVISYSARSFFEKKRFCLQTKKNHWEIFTSIFVIGPNITRMMLRYFFYVSMIDGSRKERGPKHKSKRRKTFKMHSTVENFSQMNSLPKKIVKDERKSSHSENTLTAGMLYTCALKALTIIRLSGDSFLWGCIGHANCFAAFLLLVFHMSNLFSFCPTECFNDFDNDFIFF